MKRVKQMQCEGIDLGEGIVTQEANHEGYKYLGILERKDVYQNEMKEMVRREYFNQIRAALASRLNSGNIISGYCIWYGARTIKWNEEEFDRLDQQTRKLITIHGGLPPWSSVDKLYIPKTQGGRDQSHKQSWLERLNLLLHAGDSDEKFLKATSKELQLKARLERKNKENKKRKHRTVGKKNLYTANSWEKLKNQKRDRGGNG